MADPNSSAAQPKFPGWNILGILSIVAGLLGWWASFRLFLDYTASLKDSGFVPSCDLSAVVSCAQNFGSSYGSLFGFSNTVIGLTLFAVPIVIGVLILGRVRLPRWVLLGYSIGLTAAVLLVSYLQWASFVELKTLCLYCLLIWSVVIPLFWAFLPQAIRAISSGGRANSVSKALWANWWLIALVHLSVILVVGELSMGAVSGLVKALIG